MKNRRRGFRLDPLTNEIYTEERYNPTATIAEEQADDEDDEEDLDNGDEDEEDNEEIESDKEDEVCLLSTASLSFEC